MNKTLISLDGLSFADRTAEVSPWLNTPPDHTLSTCVEYVPPAPAPEGYEWAGEYRLGRRGEWVAGELSGGLIIPIEPCQVLHSNPIAPRHILHKHPTLDPVPAGKRVVGFRLPKRHEHFWSWETNGVLFTGEDWNDTFGTKYDPEPWYRSRRLILEDIPAPAPAPVTKTRGEEVAENFVSGEPASRYVAKLIDQERAAARREAFEDAAAWMQSMGLQGAEMRFRSHFLPQ